MPLAFSVFPFFNTVFLGAIVRLTWVPVHVVWNRPILPDECAFNFLVIEPYQVALFVGIEFHEVYHEIIICRTIDCRQLSTHCCTFRYWVIKSFSSDEAQKQLAPDRWKPCPEHEQVQASCLFLLPAAPAPASVPYAPVAPAPAVTFSAAPVVPSPTPAAPAPVPAAPPTDPVPAAAAPPPVGVFDTLSDSIQSLNFAKKWLNIALPKIQFKILFN